MNTFFRMTCNMPMRVLILVVCLLSSAFSFAANDDPPSFDYQTARAHELRPHRRTIPLKGVSAGFNQLHLTLTVSPAGQVLTADPGGDNELLKFWPQLQDEVMQWKFTPFEEDGKAVTAEIKEYIDLVPPERLPKKHVTPPALRSNSKVTVQLLRTGCFGTCPSYTVTVSTGGIIFNGHGYVVAAGKHTDAANATELRELARKFIAADFYSMAESYRAGVTDNPTYVLSIDIDGHKKQVEDYVGEWVGMPAVISELEDQVDSFARTDRWINGSEGLVPALQAEGYNFHTFDAQVMLKESLLHSPAATVRELLEAGIPLQLLPFPKPQEPGTVSPFEHAGWLSSASGNPDSLQILMAAGASKNDQNDKDLALASAAGSGRLDASRALIAYGANPNANLSKLTLEHSSGGFLMGEYGAGSILFYAARSGNPDMVREILRYHPQLEMRDSQGQTAMFAAGEYRDGDKDGARRECIRLLAEAGAEVNARDNLGNTPLHGTFLTDVEEELLKLGADVNARNNDGETPIFTTVDNDAIPLFIKYGADLSIRNNKGETVVDAAKGKGAPREEALRKAIQNPAGREH